MSRGRRAGSRVNSRSLRYATSDVNHAANVKAKVDSWLLISTLRAVEATQQEPLALMPPRVALMPPLNH